MPVLGWEKCYVLGKESAPYRRRVPHPIHRRSPPSDNHWPHVPRGRPDRPRPWAGTPLSAVGATAADHSVGTQQPLSHRLETGLEVLDRAWPIVVHSRP
ncbi:hypothetical protein SGR_2117 [Streptomyces griseus subsp. griseus NBRC 13350]|uniref:Uncharacterized protein n=1 Tax=Streptomyces griseus subsp. griseus (strain JCM 4626 / CBS 651.72 / NBRC 13350 / KCC S-0626 / ISP 5235) TaxID=455632 RepID=B1W057_STRGG|nr:hypothetical protein [Streptomyces griseus]BAG18946.1 hypothetical protein SGR_2117 [Streptomyces griseus subsp. griseus NBRC 13350]